MSGLTGVESLMKKLGEIQGAPREAARQALQEGAEKITAMQKSLVPIDSGALRASINYTFGNFNPDTFSVRGLATGGTPSRRRRKSDNLGREARTKSREFLGDPDLTVTIHAGGAGVPHAGYIEYGTNPHRLGGKFKGALHSGTAAQPYFFVSVRALEASVKSDITRKMRRAIKESLK